MSLQKIKIYENTWTNEKGYRIIIMRSISIICYTPSGFQHKSFKFYKL